MSDLNAANVDDVKDFFRIYYSPNNAVLTLVGDIDPDAALALVKKYFGSIPSQPAPPKVDLLDEPHYGERREVIYDPLARLPQIDIAYHIPPGNTPENYAADQLSIILGQGESSRFYQDLVKDKQLASQITVQADRRIGTSQLYIEATPRPGVKVEDLEKGINDEIATVLKNGVTPAELAKAKRVQLIQFIERRRSALRTAVLIGDYTVYFNDPNLINTIQEKRNAITVDQVNAVIKTYLVADQRTVVITYPAADANAGSKGAQ